MQKYQRIIVFLKVSSFWLICFICEENVKLMRGKFMNILVLLSNMVEQEAFMIERIVNTSNQN